MCIRDRFSAGAAMPPYLADLNEAQRQAVEAIEGPVLVLSLIHISMPISIT